MHVFGTKILFKVIQFYTFASENKSNNRNDYLSIVSIELCLIQSTHAMAMLKLCNDLLKHNILIKDICWYVNIFD